MEDIFQCIGDVLDTYLDYERSYLVMGEISYGRFLVSLDAMDGLMANRIPHYLGYVRNQILDYEEKYF